MRTYQTAQVAKIIGIHPNTVRLYEELELIPKPERLPNGYRVFTEFHLDMLRLARTAFQIEVLQNGLRKKIVNMVKTAAAGDLASALSLTEEYLSLVGSERENAREAIGIVRNILSGAAASAPMRLRRREAAAYLQVTTDTLRNWELNGLITIKRRENGYRVYTEEDLDRLKIIRSLRCANYSLEAILHMLSSLSANPDADIELILDTPRMEDDGIISVCDKLLTSLKLARDNAVAIRQMLLEMEEKY